MPSQLSGASAVAIQVYQALYGRAPSNSLLQSYTAQASPNAQQTSAAAASAFANDLASGFQTTTSAALAKQVLDNVNITAATVTAPGSYTTLLSALEQAFTGFGPAARGQIILNLTNLLAKLEGDATYGVAATGFNNQAYADFTYASVGTNTSPSVVTPALNTFSLTLGTDNIQGTSGDDVIIARIFGNANSLKSGDKIAGGAGNDTLIADVGDSQGFAITAETTGVENVQIRAQTNQFDAAQNNIGITQIDAQRMVGVNRWESNNSRSDLIIEDVRILPNQITKDITIAFVESDPGHVDFGLYFDQLSLRSQSNTTSVLAIEILDTRSAALGTGPLKDNPYDSFAFLINGTAIIVKSPAIDAALTYADLRTAISDQITVLKATQPLLANFTVTLGAEFTRFDTQTGQAVKGNAIVLTDTGGGVLTVNPAAGFATPSGVVPPSSGLHTNISTVATSTTDKVTSKVILDDVGRGSTSGDLVIGGLSTGASSTSKGVERFEIEVRDNSKLETINSTNNTLQEVTFVNGLTTSSSFAYGTTVKDKGNLTVNGVSGLNGGNVTLPRLLNSNVLANAFIPVPVTSGVGQAYGIDPQTGNNTPLPGSAAQTARNYGFSDVRLLDGSAFTGQLAFSAEVTGASIAKYLNLRDTGALPAADNIAFVYNGGANNDSMFVTIDASVVGSRSSIVSGREDFTFTANGGAGNDNITLNVVNGLAGGAQAWYTNQKLNANIFVNGGDGNDTIRTPGAGDVIIDAGAGDDTVYTDNTGSLGAIAASGSAATSAAVAYTNAAAAELAATQSAAVLSQTTGFSNTSGTTGLAFISAAQKVINLAALDQVTPTGNTALPAIPYANIRTATQTAADNGAITLQQKIDIDAAYGATTTSPTIVPSTALATAATLTGAVNTGGNVTQANLTTGDAVVAGIVAAARGAAAIAAAADANLIYQSSFLDVTQTNVLNATSAINRVFDPVAGVQEGSAVTVAGLAAVQGALVVGGTQATVVSALDVAVANGSLTQGEANALFAAAGAFPIAAAGAAAVTAILSVTQNTAALTLAADTGVLNAAVAADLVAVGVVAQAVAASPVVIDSSPLANDASGQNETTTVSTAAALASTRAGVDVAAAAAINAALTGMKAGVNVGTLDAGVTNTIANANAAINFAIANSATNGTGAVNVNPLTAATPGLLTLAGVPSAAVDAAEELAFDTGPLGVFNVDSVDSLVIANTAVLDRLTIVAANRAATAAATLTASTIATAAANSGGNSLNIFAPRAVFVFDTTNQTSSYNRLTQDDRNLADLKSDVNNSNNFFNSTVKVTFKGLDASVVVAGSGFKTTDLEINQAIKLAVNSDPVLSKLLLATDGPANTLVVTSLIDGTQTTANLAVTVTMATSVTSSDLSGAIAAGLVPAGSTDAALITAMGVAKAAFDAKGDYVTQFAESGAAGGNTVLVGANSLSSSDNTITPGAGNDVIVLGTTVGTDLLTSSNEVVVYAGLFGNDTIVNFAVAGFGVDKLNFSALNGSSANFGSFSADKSIVVGTATAVGATVLTAAQIAALFTDSATAINHVYVAVDSNNIGSVWQVADAVGTAAGNVTATLVGSIDLADTNWAGVTAANFV